MLQKEVRIIYRLRIDTGSLDTHCIQVYTFSTMIAVMVYHTY